MSFLRIRQAITIALSFTISVTATSAAENHIVPLNELRRAVVTASESRQTNIAEAEQFFSSEQVEKILRSARLGGAKVRQAIPLLSDDELQRLSSRTDQVRSDITAGALSNQELT
jgi:hypothetical protein